MSADRVKTPFDKMVDKFNEMLIHVDVSPEYRKELRSVAETAAATVTNWYNKFNEPEPFNVETAGQILTVFKEENIALKEQLAASQAENAELRKMLERMDGWLNERHLGGLMPDEKEILNRPTNDACLKNKIAEVVSSSVACHVSTVQAQAKRITELETLSGHVLKMKEALEYIGRFYEPTNVDAETMKKKATSTLDGINTNEW